MENKKYRPGDLVADFKRRVIFLYDGQNFTFSSSMQTRLLTPGEQTIYKREFPNRVQVTFKEFKAVMEVFNCARRRGVIYAHVPLDEDSYLFFRSIRDSRFHYARTFEEKLGVLILSYHQMIHNSNEKRPNPVPDQPVSFVVF